jgi:arylsulfatase A-like enzyme
MGVIREALAAPPPSRHAFVTEVPPGARLSVAAGIPARYHREPGVEFSVKVGAPGREETALSRLVDPANHGGHRLWVPLDVDLARWAGRRVSVVLETRGFDDAGEPDRAYWGNPLVTTDRGPAPPLVVLYLVDALRADHLPIYGYPRDTAPNLGRLAADGVVFDQAIASSSWTKPSLASLFTSLRPQDHGCLQFYSPLEAAHVTLAERLRAAGYLTGAVVANPILVGTKVGFAQGFSWFAAARSPLHAAGVVDDALGFLDRTHGLPRFLYVHTMDNHDPYDAPPPFDRRFEPPPGMPDELGRMVAQYDGEIAYGDEQLGRLLESLERRGLYDDALVVVVADHGEEFRERGNLGHGRTLADELVRVPLVVKYPGGRHAGRRVASQVQLVDVLPTILKSQGLPLPGVIAGRPLEEALLGPPGERPVVFETKHREHVAYGARTEGRKYVREFYPRDRERYFDLVRDPGETQGLAEPPSPAFAELKRVAEEGTGRPAFAYRILVEGHERYELTLRTKGWIDAVEAEGLGEEESAAADPGGRQARLVLLPAPGAPRSVLVRVRPHGIPLELDGTRGGRRLRGRDVRIGGVGLRLEGVPSALPEVELVEDPFRAPPPAPAGIAVWLVPTGPGEAPEMDPETMEKLKALGYL